MDILHLADGESFSVGMDVPVSLGTGQLEKLGNCCIFLAGAGYARVEIGLEACELYRNSIMILSDGTAFRCTESSSNFSGSYITFTSEVWAEATSRLDPKFFAFLKKYPSFSGMQEMHVRRFRHVLNAMLSIYDVDGAGLRRQMFVNFLQNFLIDIFDKTKVQFQNNGDNETSRQKELFEKFIFLVLKYCSTQREVNFYAGRLCITTRYLSSIVQNISGQTPKKIICSYSIQEIKMQLRNTNDTMQEIAFRMHFPDQSFFARYFRKHTGMSPVEYRDKREKTGRHMSDDAV